MTTRRRRRRRTAIRRKKTGTNITKLIVIAVATSRERRGVSAAALKKALAVGGFDVKRNSARIKAAIKSLLARGILVQSRKTGLTGPFKINQKVKKRAKRRIAAKRSLNRAKRVLFAGPKQQTRRRSKKRTGATRRKRAAKQN